jgi:hypothetical protein
MPSVNLRRKLDHHRQKMAQGAGRWQGAEHEAFLRKENEWAAQAETDIDRIRAMEQERSRAHIGVIEDIGTSHYKHDAENKRSPHIVLRRDDGTTETIWGALLPEAIEKAQVAAGDRISIQMTGRHKVLQDVKVKDRETGETRIERREVPRNVWAAEKLPALEAERAEGTVRLYRGEQPGAPAFAGSRMTGGWFTTDAQKAHDHGEVHYVDVPASEMRHFAQGHGGSDKFVTDNPKYREAMKPLSEASAERPAARTEATGEVARTPREMEAARKQLPQAEGADVLEGVTGETIAQPRHLDGFTFEQRAKNEIHYARRDNSGQRGKTEFIDRGARVDLVNSKDDAVLLAALQVSANKWDAIQITGSQDYKNRVIRLAAEHDFNISNPELQDQIVQERGRIAASRAQSAEANSMSEGARQQAENQPDAPQPVSPERAKAYADAAGALTTQAIPAASAESRQALYAAVGKFTGVSLAGDAPQLDVEERTAVQGAMDGLSRRIYSPEPTDMIEQLRGQAAALVALSAIAPENGLTSGPYYHARPGDTHAAYAVGRRLDDLRRPLTDAAFAGDEGAFAKLAQEHTDLRGLHEAIRSRSADPDPRARDALATLIGALQAEKADAKPTEAPGIARQRDQDLSALRAYERKLPGEGEARAPLARHSDGELAIETERLRERAEGEASRETHQANAADRRNEHTPADGTLAHPYRSPDEAQAARDASASLDADPNRRIAAEPGESPETERLRQDLQKLSHIKADEKNQQKREMTREERVRALSDAARARMAQDDEDDDE